MKETAEIERLVRLITDQVMARLQAGAGAQAVPARPLWLLLAGPSGRLADVAGQAGRLLRAGAGLRLLAVPGLEQAGERLALPGPVQVLTAEALCSLLSGGDEPAALLLAGAGLQLCRRIIAADDEQPAVRLVWHFLLQSRPVLRLEEEPGPAGVPGEGAAPQLARRLARELQRLGVEDCPVGDWAGRVLPWLRRPGTAEQALQGLLTEQAVESLAGQGQRRLLIARGTIVTPLAASRAAELGVEIVREQQ